jgi:hypothetical protein
MPFSSKLPVTINLKHLYIALAYPYTFKSQDWSDQISEPLQQHLQANPCQLELHIDGSVAPPVTTMFSILSKRAAEEETKVPYSMKALPLFDILCSCDLINARCSSHNYYGANKLV